MENEILLLSFFLFKKKLFHTIRHNLFDINSFCQSICYASIFLYFAFTNRQKIQLF